MNPGDKTAEKNKELRTFKTESVVAELARQPGSSILGTVSPALRQEIIVGLRISPLISPRRVKLCCDALAAHA